MKETSVTRLSLDEVKKLLELQTIPGQPWELERFRKWIEKLVERSGKMEVRENRRNLLRQWEQQLKAKSKSCC
jgi:hypothetical protein